MKKACRAVLALIAAGAVGMGAQSPYNTVTFKPSATITATSVTSAPINLGQQTQSGVGNYGAWSAGKVTVTGSNLTTVTFSVLGSADGGVTYYPLAVNAVGSPGTTATSVTATANGLYEFSLAGLTNIEFQTSGTFTATSVTFTLTAAPNGSIGRSTGGGGGGDTITSPNSTLTVGGTDTATTLDVSTTAALAVASVTATGAVKSKIQNGVSISCNYTGATVDVRINACVTDAETLANGNNSGVCDARCETGAQTIAAQINAGDSNQDPVTLLLPPNGTWNATMTDGTSCALKQWTNSWVAGTDPAGTDDFYIGAGAASNLGYVYCNDTRTAGSTRLGGKYMYLEGVAFANFNVATANATGFYIANQQDGTTVKNVTVLDNFDASTAVINGMCCGAQFISFVVNPNYLAGSIPLTIENTASGATANEELIFNGLSAGHPGAGQPNIKLTDTEGTNVGTVILNGVYMESSTTNGTQCMIQSSGLRRLIIHGVTLRDQATGANTATFCGVSNDTAYHTDLELTGLSFLPSGAGSWVNPVASAVIDNFTSRPAVPSDLYGNMGAFHGSTESVANLVNSATTTAPGVLIGGITSLTTPFYPLFQIGTGTPTRPSGGTLLEVDGLTGCGDLANFTVNNSAEAHIDCSGNYVGTKYSDSTNESVLGATGLGIGTGACIEFSTSASGGGTKDAGLCRSGTNTVSVTTGGTTGSGGSLIANGLTLSGFTTAGIVTNNASGVLATQTLAAAGVASALSVPTGTATYTPGTNVTSCACAASYSCNNTRGTLTIAGGTATTGTICTVNFSATLSGAPACFAWMNGGATFFGIGNGIPTATSFTISSAVSVAASTATVNYTCQP